MRIVGLLPMKGHSERVPGKNLRPFAGRPLFAWVTGSLLGSNQIDLVVVDTDSDEIEEAVESEFETDVVVVRRPRHLHGDTVPMHDIVSHLASTIEGDVFVQTHATNPLLTSLTIDSAIDAYLEPGDHDSLMTVTPRQTRFYWENGQPVNHDPSILLRTQDLPPLLEENSNLYVASREVIEVTGRRIGARPLLFKMDPSEAIDIDEELDLLIAEQIFMWHSSP